MSNSLRPYGLSPTRILCPWDSPGKNIGGGSCYLLQGIFPTQGSNPGLLHCRWVLYQLSYQTILTGVTSGPRFPVERGEVVRGHRQAPAVKVRVPVAFGSGACRAPGASEAARPRGWGLVHLSGGGQVDSEVSGG